MSWARKYLRIPFVDGGRDWKGCDCWGIVRLAYKNELGVDLPSYGDISAEDLIRKQEAFEAGETDFVHWQIVSSPKPFDVVVMRIYGGREVGHCGIVTDDGRILHSDGKAGPCITEWSDPLVRTRIRFTRRHHTQCSH